MSTNTDTNIMTNTARELDVLHAQPPNKPISTKEEIADPHYIINSLTSEGKILKAELASERSRIDALQKLVKEGDPKLERADQELKKLQDDYDRESESHTWQRVDEDRKDYARRKQKLEEMVYKEREANKELKTQLDGLQKEKTDLEKKQAEELEKWTSQRGTLEERARSLRAQLAESQTREASLEHSLKRQGTQKKELEEEMKHLKKKVEDSKELERSLLEVRNGLHGQLDGLKEKIKAKKQQLVEAQAKAENMKNEMVLLKKTLNAKEARIEFPQNKLKEPTLSHETPMEKFNKLEPKVEAKETLKTHPPASNDLKGKEMKNLPKRRASFSVKERVQVQILKEPFPRKRTCLNQAFLDFQEEHKKPSLPKLNLENLPKLNLRNSLSGQFNLQSFPTRPSTSKASLLSTRDQFN